MCAPEARVKVPEVAGEVPQDRVCVGAEPFTAQAMPAGIELPPASSDHETPVPLGSGSESVVPVESPGPALDRVTVKPMGLPALTETASWVLVRVRLGDATVKTSDWHGLFVATFCPSPEYEACQ